MPILVVPDSGPSPEPIQRRPISFGPKARRHHSNAWSWARWLLGNAARLPSGQRPAAAIVTLGPERAGSRETYETQNEAFHSLMDQMTK